MDNNEKPQTLQLPLLITRELILFPGSPQTIEAGRQISINAVNASRFSADSLIFITSQINPEIENPTFQDIFQVGVLCRITTANDHGDSVRLRVMPTERVELNNFREIDGYYVCDGKVLTLETVEAKKQEDLVRLLTQTINSMPDLMTRMPKNLLNQIAKTVEAPVLCYSLLSFLQARLDLKAQALETNSVEKLVNFTLNALSGEKENVELERRIQDSVRESTEKSQKEYFLREKMRAIKKELGDETLDEQDADKILEKLEKNPYPEHVKAKVKSELKKFELMPQASLEASLIQNYIETIMSVPWYQRTIDNEDLVNVEKILDEDHYGLEKVKKRIVEYLAVKKLTGNLKSPILCFFGPPGCGKTSLGKSIARALGRKFVKASLGGISDEAEIRGHRRTYVGSMPGRIITGMKKAGVTNPVFLLDEVDKLASSYKGDPSSALLEVLDPEQNTMFNDNYLEEPYDLSDVLFICTANYLENVPAPLRDRLELIEVNSYTELEKVQIAKIHLIPKQIELNGLKKEQVSFHDESITYIIQHYTREAGVRDLERKIAGCLRKVVVSIVKDPSIKAVDITPKKVAEFLGTEIFENSKKEKEQQIGVVTGLAYTEYGGDILPIEVNYFPGKGGLILTGHLGDVMKESAAIALDYVRANAARYKIDSELFAKNDIHIHVPEGAVPKDGPSAGVAITTAIISCLSHTAVDPNVAMTGEVTLRGNALPIGGLREKSLAALRSGIKTIIVPDENKKSVDELPKEVKEALTIVYMKTVDDALKVALIGK
ncbi:MAG: endopeptidase La [Erysipelotrichaceae bacterium]|nr:endopeptidase La [Erysipelotrichaceae bacterium]